VYANFLSKQAEADQKKLDKEEKAKVVIEEEAKQGKHETCKV